MRDVFLRNPSPPIQGSLFLISKADSEKQPRGIPNSLAFLAKCFHDTTFSCLPPNSVNFSRNINSSFGSFKISLGEGNGVNRSLIVIYVFATWNKLNIFCDLCML